MNGQGELARAFAPYVAEVRPSNDLYAEVLRWHRRRRRVRVAGFLSVLTAAGVATAVAIAGAPAAVQLPGKGPVATPTPGVTYTHPNGVRGTLGGNQQLLDDATRAAFAEFRANSGSQVSDPDHITPVFAERSGQFVVVLFTGTSRTMRDWIFDVKATKQGSGRWLIESGGGVHSAKPALADADIKYAQKSYGDPFWVTNATYANSGYVAIVVPPTTRAEVAYGLEVSAEGTVGRQYRPLELHAGTALIQMNGSGSVRLSAGNKVLATWTNQQTSARTMPTTAEVAAAAKQARGHADATTAKAAAQMVYFDAHRFGSAGMRFRVIWGGLLAGRQCVLAAYQYPSGALYPNWVCDEPDGLSGSSDGTVAAGTFDHRMLAWTSFDHSYLVMAPPGAVRAEFVYAGRAPVPVPLDNGLGHTEQAGTATAVRTFDAAGNLIEQRRIDDGFHSTG